MIFRSYRSLKKSGFNSTRNVEFSKAIRHQMVETCGPIIFDINARKPGLCMERLTSNSPR